MQQLGADTDKSILLCDDDNDLSACPISDFTVFTAHRGVRLPCVYTERSCMALVFFQKSCMQWPVRLSMNDS